jgi:hypothetical protein
MKALILDLILANLKLILYNQINTAFIVAILSVIRANLLRKAAQKSGLHNQTAKFTGKFCPAVFCSGIRRWFQGSGDYSLVSRLY